MSEQFKNPSPVTSLEMAFGGDMNKLLPEWEVIPEDFKRNRTKWDKIITRWFYHGLPENTVYIPKSGIIANEALAHVAAILASFEPKHEHKSAGCAYLLSLWFEDIVIPDVSATPINP